MNAFLSQAPSNASSPIPPRRVTCDNRRAGVPKRGGHTPASAGRSAARLAVTVICALLVGGCVDQTPTPRAAPKPSTVPLAATTTPAATTTSPEIAEVSGLTAQEAAWLKGITNLSRKLDNASAVGYDLTPAALRSLANQTRGCARELARLGPPSDRLEPVSRLARKGCAQYAKGAQCFATAARIGEPRPGSASERAWEQAMDCGFAGLDNGSDLFRDAELKADDITFAAG